MIYILYFLLTLLGIVVIVFLPILWCLHIVKVRPHSKVGKWISKHIISDIDLEPIKAKPLEKGLMDDDVLEPPLKNDL
jgi:hypothetical protein